MLEDSVGHVKVPNTKWVGVYGVDMPNRRNVLIGLGGLVAGGGALIGTGAFDTVEAQRDVTVETTGDADAFLGLEPARDALGLDGEDFVEETDGTVEIQIDDSNDDEDTGAGLNQNAITTFNHLVYVTNQGTQEVDSLTLEFTDVDDDINDEGDTFNFPVAEVGDVGGDELGITDGPETIEYDGSELEILDTAATPGTLSPGDGVVFGLEINLIDGGDGDNDLPDEGDYTLTIEANAAE